MYVVFTTNANLQSAPEHGGEGTMQVTRTMPRFLSFLDRRHLSASAREHRVVRLFALSVAGLVLEAVLLVGFLRPLQIAWHPQIARTLTPLKTVLGPGYPGALRFALPAVAASVLFAVALWLAQRLSGRVAVGLVLAGTVLFTLTFLPINPLGAHDVYHNIADARTFWLYGDNPAIVPPSAHPDDPFFGHLTVWTDFPSAYGPLWYLLSGLPLPFTGAALWPSVIGQKALTATFLLATTVLVMATAERIRPGAAPAAGVLVGWNPLLQFDTAGNAHNDIVLVCFGVAALSAAVRRWWLAVFPLLALAVATKYVLVLLGPVLFLWMLRQPAIPGRQILLSLGLAGLTLVAVYAPFSQPLQMLLGLRREAGHLTSSPAALLQVLFWTRLQIDLETAGSIAQGIAVVLFLVGYVLLLLRLPRSASPAVLVRTCCWVVFLFLVIAQGWFWPWYVVWLVPLAALLPGSRPALVAAAFSATALLMNVAYFWLLFGDSVRLHAVTVAIGFVVPVLLAIVPVRSVLRTGWPWTRSPT